MIMSSHGEIVLEVEDSSVIESLCNVQSAPPGEADSLNFINPLQHWGTTWTYKKGSKELNNQLQNAPQNT